MCLLSAKFRSSPLGLCEGARAELSMCEFLKFAWPTSSKGSGWALRERGHGDRAMKYGSLVPHPFQLGFYHLLNSCEI